MLRTILFMNNETNKVISFLSTNVREGTDSYFIVGENMSLPKSSWSMVVGM